MSIKYAGYVMQCDHCPNKITAETMYRLEQIAVENGWENEAMHGLYGKSKCPLCIKEDAALDKMKNPATNSAFAS